jgi:enoyl-CoA hydratase
MTTPRSNRVVDEGDGPMGPTRLQLSKPVIAAVSGYAVAGGFELALWCDLRVVEADATFGVFCRRWGVPLIDGGTVRLPRLIGQSRALDLILTGRPVEAEEALAIGLANRVVAPGTAREEAEALAASLAELPQDCLRNDRLSTLSGYGLDERSALAVEFGYGRASLASPELATGVRRFQGGSGRHGASA